MSDMLGDRGMSFTNHDYHKTCFGLHYGDGELPDAADANHGLIDLFRKKLRGG